MAIYINGFLSCMKFGLISLVGARIISLRLNVWYIYLHLPTFTEHNQGSLSVHCSIKNQKPPAMRFTSSMAPLPRGTAKGRMPKIRLPQIPQSAKHAAAGGKPSQKQREINLWISRNRWCLWDGYDFSFACWEKSHVCMFFSVESVQ